MVDTSFSHCPFNLLERNANADDRFNLQKTNAANEGWLADFSADARSWKWKARPLPTHSNSLSNEMDNIPTGC